MFYQLITQMINVLNTVQTRYKKLMNRTSSRIVRVATASGPAQEFQIVLLPKIKIKNNPSSVYSRLWGTLWSSEVSELFLLGEKSGDISHLARIFQTLLFGFAIFEIPIIKLNGHSRFSKKMSHSKICLWQLENPKGPRGRGTQKTNSYA